MSLEQDLTRIEKIETPMGMGFRLPHGSVVQSDASTLEKEFMNPILGVPYGLKELPFYVVVEGNSQEGPGEIVLVSRDKMKALDKWKEETYYSAIYEVYPDGPIRELQVVACEWKVQIGYKETDEVERIKNPETEFTKACVKLHEKMGRQDIELRFANLGPTYYNATLWQSGPIEHGGTLFLQGRVIAHIACIPSDWQYQPENPGLGASSQCQTEV
jgi:hypothetical protein